MGAGPLGGTQGLPPHTSCSARESSPHCATTAEPPHCTLGQLPPAPRPPAHPWLLLLPRSCKASLSWDSRPRCPLSYLSLLPPPLRTCLPAHPPVSVPSLHQDQRGELPSEGLPGRLALPPSLPSSPLSAGTQGTYWGDHRATSKARHGGLLSVTPPKPHREPCPAHAGAPRSPSSASGVARGPLPTPGPPCDTHPAPPGSCRASSPDVSRQSLSHI